MKVKEFLRLIPFKGIWPSGVICIKELPAGNDTIKVLYYLGVQSRIIRMIKIESIIKGG